MSAKKTRLKDRLPLQSFILDQLGVKTFDEIAKILEVSLNTAASRYRYAMEKLKKWVPELLLEPKEKDLA